MKILIEFSASSPAFAALVSLLNNKRLADGKKPLGFLNPWFYSHANAKGGFTDIKDGRSTGCTGVDQYSGLPTPYVPGAGKFAAFSALKTSAN